MKRFALIFLIPSVIVLAGIPAVTAQDDGTTVDDKTASSQSADDRASIATAIKLYEEAFNSRDAKGLAKHWSREGVYTSRLTGQAIVGRNALEKEFTSLFAEVNDTKMELETKSIEFVSPNVAIEQGVATIIQPENEPAKSGYSVVYVKREGQWLIDRVSEDEEPAAAPTHHEQLKDLAWIIGDWVDQDGSGITIETTCKWTRNQNFITRSFSASNEDRISITGMQFVGWDAASKQIRSWAFDSDGGVAEGNWKLKGKNWIVNTTATLTDGKKASSTTIFRPMGENSFGWQKTNRVVDGEILPNIDEVLIVREGTE